MDDVVYKPHVGQVSSLAADVPSRIMAIPPAQRSTTYPLARFRTELSTKLCTWTHHEKLDPLIEYIVPIPPMPKIVAATRTYGVASNSLTGWRHPKTSGAKSAAIGDTPPRLSFEDVTFQIYEKNADIGGTWYENRYPGRACSNPSHTYVWSFDPNPTWSSPYASSSEIYEYFKRFQFRFNLGEKTKLNHHVVDATWDDASGRWEVVIKDLSSGQITKGHCEVLINAGGIFNHWSAAWNQSLDLTGKHVGLIGNGYTPSRVPYAITAGACSSGIQFLPAILPQVSHCTTFIREPTWVAVAGFSGFNPRKFTQEEKAAFLSDPIKLQTLRRWLEHNANRTFPLFLEDGPAQSQVH
ncbi:integral peroxisomal membrane protein [Fonsecaea nubica]|uniref:Integral peroxisomal membrane protein n=1 Tax=Fonsecaea nubica TaxID=856822 RepID=A0A178CPE7_9EURO|nr:integral peroxisomal membrane protein [Fonsecaea nubica]OAL31709.1 integral peroxisomal membrane protein [Fonsecaea nubica]